MPFCFCMIVKSLNGNATEHLELEDWFWLKSTTKVPQRSDEDDPNLQAVPYFGDCPFGVLNVNMKSGSGSWCCNAPKSLGSKRNGASYFHDSKLTSRVSLLDHSYEEFWYKDGWCMKVWSLYIQRFVFWGWRGDFVESLLVCDNATENEQG